MPKPSSETAASIADSRAAYVHEVLRRYLETPGVSGRVRHADRSFAGALYDQRVPLYAVQYAFIVAAARRVRHNAFSTPLPPIRSLWYFREVIREMLDRPPGFREIDQMREILLRQR